MKRAFAVVLLTAAVVGMTTACGSSNSNPTETRDTSPAGLAYSSQMREVAASIARFNRVAQGRDAGSPDKTVVKDLRQEAANYGHAVIVLQKMHPPAAAVVYHKNLIDGMKLYRSELLAAVPKIARGDRLPLTALNNAKGIAVMNLASLELYKAGYNVLTINLNGT